MDLSALLKPQALRTLYLAYSSYKRPNFRPTHRPTEFGRRRQCGFNSNAFPPARQQSPQSRHYQINRTQFPGSREIIRQRSTFDFGSRSHFGTARDSLLSAFPDWREGVKILGILFSRSGHAPQVSACCKSCMCKDKHSRNRIMSAHPSGEFSAAYRHQREPGEPGVYSR